MELILALITAFSASLMAIPASQPLAEKLDLVDRPDHRKIHSGEVPLIGGIAVFIGVMIAVTLWLPAHKSFNLYLIAASLLLFIGILDDRHNLSVRSRIVGQLLVASIMVFGDGMYISKLGNFMGLGEIELGVLGIPFTYLAVLGAINAFNMIDGIDGLAGSLAIVTLVAISSLLALNGNPTHAALGLIVAAAIVPFLYYNLRGAKTRMGKIFMGDAGSMFIGFSVVWLLISGTQSESQAFSPVTALWLIAVPLMDMASIMVSRVSQGQSPFMPARDHIHHLLMTKGIGGKSVLCRIVALAVLLAAVGMSLELQTDIPAYGSLALFMAVFLAYFGAFHCHKIIGNR